MKTLGIALLAIGIIMTVFTGFDFTSEKKVLDLGSVEITSKEKTPIYWSPITGGVLAIVGVVLLISTRKKILR